jgi:hypothetical protein
MRGTTHILPPIAFKRLDGETAMIRDTDSLAAWLDRIYDVILDPHHPEGDATLEARSLQLLEIEKVFFALAEESDGATQGISADLRSTCMALVARYRELLPLIERARTVN